MPKFSFASHDQQPRSPCAIACGLELLGDRWTLLIIRDLMFTNRNEFGHLLNAGEGISTNILSDRLDKLQCHGIVNKHTHPSHGKKFIYELTDRGLDLAPVLIELSLWSSKVIDEAFIPKPIQQLMMRDRKTLLKKIRAREPLVTLDL